MNFKILSKPLSVTIIRSYCPAASKQPPLTGKDLIREFGLNPSVVFRRILARIEEEQLTRERLTRKQALGLVKELINR